jgi:epidermal growth factor receptor substrate 15
MAEEDVKKYDQLFLTADADKDGFVDGNEAKHFFSRSDLPLQSLSAIWKLCERDGDGKLSKGEFRLAMNLMYPL